MNCKQCGAPLEAGTELCPYCGSPTPYDETFAGEKLLQRQKQRQEEERRRKLSGLARMKYVPGPFAAVLYFCTFFFYSPWWYATRMKSLNGLSSPVKLPAWLVAVFALSCVSVFYTDPALQCLKYLAELLGEGDIETDSGSVSVYAWSIAVVASGWLAFRVRDILQNHASRYLERAVAVMTIAPSGMMLLFAGPLYLQLQVNKMISMELLTPKI